VHAESPVIAFGVPGVLWLAVPGRWISGGAAFGPAFGAEAWNSK